jgi:hypothetical protein
MSECIPAIIFVINNEEQIICVKQIALPDKYYNILNEAQKHDMQIMFNQFCPRTGYKLSEEEVYEYVVKKAYEERLENIIQECEAAKEEAKTTFEELSKVKFIIKDET